jgi:Stage III sporulation protein AF (Spore_III_AF).
MSAVKEWSAAICIAVLAAALLQNLVPNGSMERMIRFVIGAFVICVLIQPVASIVPQIDFNLQEPAQGSTPTHLQETVNTQLSDAAQQSIRNMVTAELGRIGIKCENVSVIMDTHEDGSISINKVVVTLAKGYGASCDTAAGQLEKVTGLKMEVTADG